MSPSEASAAATAYDSRQRRFMQAVRGGTDRSIGGWLARAGVTPNQVTWAGMYGGVLGCLIFMAEALYHPLYWWGLGVFLLFSASDFIDGSVARRAPLRKTPFGAVLDSFTDRRIEMAMIFAISVVLYESHHPVLALLCLPMHAGFDAVPYARAKAESIRRRNADGKEESLKGDVGLGERPVRMALLAPFVVFGYWWPVALGVGVLVSGLLAWATAFQRERYIRRQLENSQR